MTIIGAMRVMTRVKTMTLPRIRLVDDDKDITNVLSKGLRLRGFYIEVFSDPLEALAQFRPDHYDFVITDIRMPQMDGFELYQKIRNQDSKVKIYFLSAYDNYEDQAKEILVADTLVRFLKKPVSFTGLAQQLLLPL
jgi:CheY-like chemotaxis protein